MPKINLKDKINDNELDLSMCDIQDVPVKEIALVKRVTSLDLSNNKIALLTVDFATSLNRLVKLDLSQNELQTLPENFGDLKNLRELDLYNNKLQHLPLSLGECKLLRWLDLKNNPLVPAISEVAGQCLDAKQCQMCAKKLVPFLHNMQVEITKECERRQAQRKREIEIREAQQVQQKKDQQKNTKKATKAERKQKEANSMHNSINKKTEKVEYSSQNDNSQLGGMKKGLFTSQVFKLIFFTLFVSALLSIYIVKYDSPKYIAVQKYLNETWNNAKQSIPPKISDRINEGYADLCLVLQSIISNIQTFFNTCTAALFQYYKFYFNEAYLAELLNGFYETYAYIVKLIIDFTNNFLRELPQIVEVLQKRLLG